MQRAGFILMAVFFLACKNKKTDDQQGNGFRYDQFQGTFKTAALPYHLADSTLLGNKDTATIRGTAFSSMIPDSIIQPIFGKGAKVKYTALAKIEEGKGVEYFIVKAAAGKRKAALLVSIDEDEQFGAAFPFLVPDADESTTQVSTMDKAYSITRTVQRKLPDDVIADGKDVYVYSKESKQFSLIMTDLLDERSAELINPIDTFSKEHKLAGDYLSSKKNIVSVRDGRRPNTLMVFVHIEKENSHCTGELKGEAQIISPTTAVYRQVGDPCELQFTFTSSAVKLTELKGCGSRRGLECLFNGTFPRKKEPKSKASSKSASKP